MRIYVITSGIGGVKHAGTDEPAVRKWAENERLARGAAEVEWREEWGGMDRLHYRDANTGRWNKIPAVFISSTELEVES